MSVHTHWVKNRKQATDTKHQPTTSPIATERSHVVTWALKHATTTTLTHSTHTRTHGTCTHHCASNTAAVVDSSVRRGWSGGAALPRGHAHSFTHQSIPADRTQVPHGWWDTHVTGPKREDQPTQAHLPKRSVPRQRNNRNRTRNTATRALSAEQTHNTKHTIRGSKDTSQAHN